MDHIRNYVAPKWTTKLAYEACGADADEDFRKGSRQAIE